MLPVLFGTMKRRIPLAMRLHWRDTWHKVACGVFAGSGTGTATSNRELIEIRLRSLREIFTRMDWDDLRFFLAVARNGSLRGAAELLQTNHATVSRRLSGLESKLEERLFERTRGGLLATQLGELLRPHAERIEDEVRSVAHRVAERNRRPSPSVTLVMPPLFGLTSVSDDLAAFMMLDREVELRIVSAETEGIRLQAEADLALCYAHEVGDDAASLRLLHCAKAVYCTPDYASRIRDDGGQGLAWIGWDAAAESWIEQSPFPKASLRHLASETVAQCMLAARGLGLSYLPCFLADPHPSLVRAPFQKPVLDRSLWLLLHRDRQAAARIRFFADFLAARIRGRKEAFLAGLAPPSDRHPAQT